MTTTPDLDADDSQRIRTEAARPPASDPGSENA